jgi:hypothetical protein
LKKEARPEVMRKPTAFSQAAKLHCKKFDRWVGEDDAQCTKPEDYCEFRERCGIYFLMTERDREMKKKVKEERNASL